MNRRTLLSALLLLSLFICLPLQASQGGNDPQMRPQMLVSTNWLGGQMHRDNVVVVHVGSTNAIYNAGHIPGARFLAMSQIAYTQNGILNEIAPVAQLKAVFESLGIGDNTQVVLYSDSQNELAARAWYTLNYVGHGDNAALLDGGLEKWKLDGRAVSTDVPTVEPATFTPRLNAGVIIHVPQVMDASWQIVNVPDTKYALLDNRSLGEYTGETPSAGVPRAGHIPGAIFVPGTSLFVSTADPEYLSPHELRYLFESLGVTRDKKVIVSCRTGMKASPFYFILTYLGYDVVMFDGSFSQWSSLPYTPVTAGSSQY